VTVGDPLRGAPRRLRGTALARGLMLADERLAPGYWGGAASFSADTLGTDWAVGDDIVTLLWQPDAVPLIRGLAADPAWRAKLNALLDGWLIVHGLAGAGPASVRSVAFTSPFLFDPGRYCAGKSLKYTLRKTGPGGSTCEFSKESLRKKVLASCIAERSADGRTTVTVEPGTKFDAEEFARLSFAMQNEEEWVRTGIFVALG
jgi:hypothetical protein